jgi:large-conductance mechanosensitive channel
MEDNALFAAKWGAQTQKMSMDYDVLTIASVQFVIVALVLFVVRPNMVLTQRTFLRSAQPSVLRVLLISAVICLVTYLKPVICG